MNVKHIIAFVKRPFYRRKNKNKPSENRRTSLAKPYRFSCQWDSERFFPKKEIRQLIMLDPWSIVSSSAIHFETDAEKPELINIRFLTLNPTRARSLEERIRAKLDNW